MQKHARFQAFRLCLLMHFLHLQASDLSYKQVLDFTHTTTQRLKALLGIFFLGIVAWSLKACAGAG